MTVDEYLTLISQQHDRGDNRTADLRPVASVELLALEHELRRPLPAPYENFLTRVGCGATHGGRWLHIDPTLKGSVLERREAVLDRLGRHRCSSRCAQGCASGLYPIFESKDGTLYGFVRYGTNRDGGFAPTVYALDPGEALLWTAAEDFDEFLDQIARCSVGAEAKVALVKPARS